MGVILFVPVAMAIAIKTRHKIEETMALAFAIMTLLVYFSGMTGSFYPGIAIISMISAISFSYCIYMLIKKNDVKKYVFTYGLFAFFILSMYFCLSSMNMHFSGIDEFNFWGLNVKNFYMYNCYSDCPQSNVGVNYYPPLMSVLEYIGTKIWICYSETMVYFSYRMMLVSLLLPVFRNIDNNDENCLHTNKTLRGIVSVFFLCIVLIVMSVIIITYGFEAIIPDTLIGLGAAFFAYMLYLYIVNNKDEYYLVCCVASIVVMALSKNTGMLLSALLISSTLIIITVCNKKRCCQINEKRIMTILVLAHALSIGSWVMYLSHGKYGRYSIGQLSLYLGMIIIPIIVCIIIKIWVMIKLNLKIEKVIVSFYIISAGLFVFLTLMCLWITVDYSSLGISDSMVLIKRFITYLLTTEGFKFGYYVAISFISLIILCLFANYGLRRIEIKKRIISNATITRFVIYNVLIVCSLAYVYFVLLDYIINITPSNGDIGLWLPSFGRYISVCANMLTLFLIYTMYEEVSYKYYELSGILILCIALVGDCSTVTNRLLYRQEEKVYWAIPHSGITIESDDSFCFVDQDWESLSDDSAAFMYYVTPGYSESFTATYNDDKSDYYSYEKMENTVSKFDYVYINELDDKNRFTSIYGDLFEDSSVVGNCTLYKVTNNGNNTELVLIGN